MTQSLGGCNVLMAVKFLDTKFPWKKSNKYEVPSGVLDVAMFFKVLNL
jgi:hypothetical protein